MADLGKLYKNRSVEEVAFLTGKALALAEKKNFVGWVDIQKELSLGFNEACIVLDWLADMNKVDISISNHWVRCGRAYVLNNPVVSLKGMADALEIGEKRAFLVMLALQKRKIIYVREDFTFRRRKQLATFMDLIRQMKVVAKKYRGRCEPYLLVRTLYIDMVSAFRLAQYGEENLGLTWKKRDLL